MDHVWNHPTTIPNQVKASEKAGSQRQKETEWIQAEVRPILQSITMEAPENMDRLEKQYRFLQLVIKQET